MFPRKEKEKCFGSIMFVNSTSYQAFSLLKHDIFVLISALLFTNLIYFSFLILFLLLTCNNLIYLKQFEF